MRPRMALWAVAIAGSMGLVWGSGCALVAVGAGAAGTVAYLEGDLKVDEPHPLNKVYAATHQALKDLRMMVVKDDKATPESRSAEIEARDVEDKKATIILSTRNEGITQISIRIGFFGDEVRSRRIYMKIHERLQ